MITPTLALCVGNNQGDCQGCINDAGNMGSGAVSTDSGPCHGVALGQVVDRVIIEF